MKPPIFELHFLQQQGERTFTDVEPVVKIYEDGRVEGVTPRTIIINRAWVRLNAAYAALRTAREALDNTGASLDTVMAHFGGKMPPEDRRARERVVVVSRQVRDDVDDVLKGVEE